MSAEKSLSSRDMQIASDIAIRFWEPRRSWPPAQAAESFRKEARRLHDQAIQCQRGDIGGLPHVWLFTASMLAVEAARLTALGR